MLRTWWAGGGGWGANSSTHTWRALRLIIKPINDNIVIQVLASAAAVQRGAYRCTAACLPAPVCRGRRRRCRRAGGRRQ